MGRRLQNEQVRRPANFHAVIFKMFGHKHLIFNKLKSYFTFFVFFVFSTLCSSQSQDSLQSIMLQDVSITASHQTFYSDDKRQSQLDTFLRKWEQSANLSQLLSVSLPVTITGNGGGAVSSILLRGTGSNHTTVNWNGLPINSLTTGGIDLSLIQSNLFDKVSLTHNASGTLYGSGSFGGAINLENTAEQIQDNSFIFTQLQSEIGSFGSKFYSLKLKVGNPFFQSNTNIFYYNSLNNFSYFDFEKFGSPKESRTHNALNNKGIEQNLFFNLPNRNKIDIGFWWQTKAKEIPALLGSYKQSNQNQEDNTFKTFVRWKKQSKKYSLQTKLAYFTDNLNFTDKSNATDTFYSINSKIETQRVLADADFRYYASEYLVIDLGTSQLLQQANVSAYQKPIEEQNFAVFAGAKWENKRILLNVSVRKEFQKRMPKMPLFSAGLRYELIKKYLAIKISYSDKFRLPSLNEKYWQPGGNPNLFPESGFGFDFSIVNQLFSTNIINISAETTIFSNKINNWIQWTPSESNYWKPINYKSVWTRGVETSAKVDFESDKLQIHTQLHYFYTKATNSEIYETRSFSEQQLRYIPKHSICLNINTVYKQFVFSANSQFVSERNTSDGNSNRVLPSYSLLNVYSGYNLSKNLFSFSILFKISNLFDTQYQAIESNPMPRRSFSISLVINGFRSKV